MNPRPLHLPLLLALSVLGSCQRPATPRSAGVSGGRPVIVTTIFPLFSLVQQLAGDWAEVRVLMPSGANPHEFELEPQQMEPLSRADLLVVVGLNLDTWAERAAARSGTGQLAIVRMADLVSPTPATQPVNPHVWMNPVSARAFVLAMGEKLATRFPEHRDASLRRARALAAALQSLDDENQATLSQVRLKELISFHNAYDPLVERYGLRVVAHLTDIDATPGGEVTARDLVEAIDAVRKYHLRVVYAEPQFPLRAAQMLSQETGVRVLTLDDLGGADRAGYDSYQAIIASDVRELKKGQNLPPKP